MKKILTLLLAALMLLSCLSALAEDAPQEELVKDMGITLTMDLERDVMDKIDNTMGLSMEGVVSHEPYCSIMDVTYCTLPEDVLDAKIVEIEAEEDPQKQAEMANENLALFVNIAEIAVAQVETPEAYLDLVGWKADEILGATEFAAMDGYHWYYVTLPIDGVIARYDELNAFGKDGAAADEAREKARREIAFCQEQMLNYLKSAKLSTPADPGAGYIGQVVQFETTDLDGNPFKSEDLFRDNKITMVNLWGTWCPNCVNEMAELAEIHTRLKEKGCGIVGIEYEQKPIEEVGETARAIMAANGTNYPSVLMPEDCALLTGVLSYPTTFFVDSEGRILTYPIEGAALEEYEKVLDKLLAGEVVDAAPDTGAAANGDNKYSVHVFDADGNPVEGAVVQFCDDVTCSFQPTDAGGVASFPVSEQKVYEVHLLKVPEGYKPDANVYNTLDTYSDVNIFLEKAE